jgi:hypothetical protein
MSEPALSGDATTGLSGMMREAPMREWLIADISLSDVHFQVWMVLVVGILLIWFILVWVTRSVR